MEKFKDEMYDKEYGHLLKLEDVADILHLPINKVRGLANTGVIPSLRMGSGAAPRFRMEDVIAYMLK